MSTRRPSQVVVEPPPTPPVPVPHLVVEFAGTPRAGKTTAMEGLHGRLEDRGLRVRCVDGEPAAVPSLPKRHPHFNLWAATATSARMIEAMHAEADVVLVDKGLFDALCWLEWYRRQGYLTPVDHRAIDQFLRVASLRELVHLVFVMTVEPAVAVQRELDDRRGRNGNEPGTVVNSDTLLDLNAAIAAMVECHRSEFTLHELDTTKMSREQTLETVVSAVERLVTVYPTPANPASSATRSIDRRTDAVSRSP